MDKQKKAFHFRSWLYYGLSVESKLFSDFPPVNTEAWEKRIQKDLESQNHSGALHWHLNENLELKPYYRSEDLQFPLPHVLARFFSQDKEGRNSSRPKGAEIRQKIYVRDPKTANAQARKLLSSGADALAFVIGTSDFNHYGACEVRQAKDIQRLIEGIDLDTKPIHFLTGLGSPAFLRLLGECLKQRNFDAQKFFSCIEHDLFSHWLRQGSLPYELSEAFHEITALLKYSGQTFPQVRCISMADEVYYASGANSAQTLGLLLAMSQELLTQLSSEFSLSLSLEEIVPKFWFQLSLSSEYFLEIARLRALRLLWLQFIHAYRPNLKKDSPLLRIHISGQSSMRNKTLFDAHSNIMRSSTESMSALIGGADSFTCLPFDAVYAMSEGLSQKKSKKAKPNRAKEELLGEHLAINTQLLHRHESYLRRVSDPAAGSYYIEKLTDALARQAWSYFQEIEKEGGIIKLLQSSRLQAQLRKQAEQKLERVARGAVTVLGVNAFPPSYTEDRASSHRSFALSHREPSPIKKKDSFETILPLTGQPRLSEGFEKLRLRTIGHVQNGGELPEVFLFLFGGLGISKRRAGFARKFFSCIGYSVMEESGLEESGLGNLEEGLEGLLKKISVKKDGSVMFALCASDQDYAKLLPALSKKLEGNFIQKSAKKAARPIYVAADPKKLRLSSILPNFIFGYIYQGMHMLQELERCQKHFGIEN